MAVLPVGTGKPHAPTRTEDYGPLSWLAGPYWRLLSCPMRERLMVESTAVPPARSVCLAALLLATADNGRDG